MFPRHRNPVLSVPATVVLRLRRLRRLGGRAFSTGTSPKSKAYFGAIDQGTSSTRFIVFDQNLKPIASHQVEIKQHFPHPGWAEMDPEEILQSVDTCAEAALQKAGIEAKDLLSVGVTNQRETTIVWDRNSGKALAPAILWFDDRTKKLCAGITEELGGDPQVLQKQSGLRINPYFSAFKLRWLLENVEDVKKAAEAKAAAFGTVESFLIYKLTGNHVSDCTNASRTMLMDLRTLEWSDELCTKLGIPLEYDLLPSKIVSNSEPEAFGTIQEGVLKGTKICGSIGDQQGALVGQRCFQPNQLKNTFGTGQFLLLNTGTDIVISDKGLLSTVGYKFGASEETTYAVEGAVAISGVGLRWMCEKLKFADSPKEIAEIAASVDSPKGLYFVPAFNGLMAPHWKPDARGIMIGLTNYHGREHVCRAMMEALCFQCRDVISAMGDDHQPDLIKVDGGVAQSSFAMQLLANLTEITVERPDSIETTAAGAAIAAGIGCGYWKDVADLDSDSVSLGSTLYHPDPSYEAEWRHGRWLEAVRRCVGWEDHHGEAN